MKFYFKKINLIACLFFVYYLNSHAFAKDSEFSYSREDIGNYFLGILASNEGSVKEAYKHLKKVQTLKSKHKNFNRQFIHTLVMLDRFDQAFSFSREVWQEDDLFFEADLLLGINSLIEKKYKNAEKYFLRLNRFSENNYILDDFLGNFLISWSRAYANDKSESFSFLNKIPTRYNNLKKIQNSFLQCYFDHAEAENVFKSLVEGEGNAFSRYNFFLINYLLRNNKDFEAKKILNDSREKYNSNLLLKQTEDFILKNKKDKIKYLFNCKNIKDNIAEIFYVIANLYSTQKNYKLSNFYLKISIFLNNKFSPNQALLAENLFFQKKYKLSKDVYSSMKSIGPAFSWYASKNVAIILSETQGKKRSTSSLIKEFDLIENPNFENYYEMGNFFKNNEYYKESIQYYSLALKNIKKNHYLIPKILDRRGTSYERLGEWSKAEKDLLKSLKILPDQAHVLNYLAYSWIEKRINIDDALKMLKKATKLKENDGYIIDSLGWAYYVSENYTEAEKFLQRAVELMPLDPVINDHYADALWMLNKNIQARYIWKHVLTLENIENKLKENIDKKLIYGITEKL
ncbi:hypothetical protein OAJ18_00630 [Pelagibacteraceae bacterium]|nr:hypothetical protein [Pelagibacteraceae bacterium]